MSNTDYILTSNWNFISEDELYHWGIKGMKCKDRPCCIYDGCFRGMEIE